MGGNRGGNQNGGKNVPGTPIVPSRPKKKKISIPKDFEIIKEKIYGNSSLTLIKLK